MKKPTGRHTIKTKGNEDAKPENTIPDNEPAVRPTHTNNSHNKTFKNEKIKEPAPLSEGERQ